MGNCLLTKAENKAPIKYHTIETYSGAGSWTCTNNGFFMQYGDSRETGVKITVNGLTPWGTDPNEQYRESKCLSYVPYMVKKGDVISWTKSTYSAWNIGFYKY